MGEPCDSGAPGAAACNWHIYCDDSDVYGARVSVQLLGLRAQARCAFHDENTAEAAPEARSTQDVCLLYCYILQYFVHRISCAS